MKNWRGNLLHAGRRIGRNPGLALTAILSLAVGIGANTAVFTVADGLLLRGPAGVDDPGRLVDVGRSQDGRGFDTNSYLNYLDLRSRSRSLASVAAYDFSPEPMSLATGDGAVRVYGSLVSANYFETLEATPARGRFFSARDGEEPGAAPYAVLSHHFWTSHFGGDETVVGRRLELNGHPFTVVGVARRGFGGTTVFRPDLWVPASMIAQAMPRASAEELHRREANWLMMVGRLAPGASIDQARAEVQTIGAALAKQYPSDDHAMGLRLEPLSSLPGAKGPLAAFVGGLMLLVALVLFIVCANLAGVLLARAAARRGEIGVRLALGASRASLVGQMLTETAVLTLAGGLLGIVLARWLTTLLVASLSALPFPVGVATALDGRVVGFALGASLFTALLAGVAPALSVTGRGAAGALKPGAQTGPRRMRLRRAFVVAQVTCSFALVVTAGLALQTLHRAAAVDPGFDPSGVQVTSLDLSLGGYDEQTGPAYVRELLERVRALPGVESASTARVLPLTGGGMGRGGVFVPGHTAEADEVDPDWNVVEPEYFATLHTRLLRGRGFGLADTAASPPVAIVNRTLAERLWPGEDPVGKVLLNRAESRGDLVPLTVVGVAQDGKYRSLGEPPRAFVWVPLRQAYDPRVNVLVRAAVGAPVGAEVRHLVRALSPTLPILQSESLSDVSAVGLLPQRIVLAACGGLGLVGVLLAAIGLFGITAYAVVSRSREIAVRMALGARRRSVVGLFLGRGMRLTLVGLGLGLALAFGASRLLASVLFGVGPLDPAALAGSALLFAVVALAATYLPARRVSAVEAAEALRAE